MKTSFMYLLVEKEKHIGQRTSASHSDVLVYVDQIFVSTTVAALDAFETAEERVRIVIYLNKTDLLVELVGSECKFFTNNIE